MTIEELKERYSKPVGCGWCAEVNVKPEIDATKTQYTVSLRCPKCLISMGQKIPVDATDDEVDSLIMKVFWCFRRAGA